MKGKEPIDVFLTENKMLTLTPEGVTRVVSPIRVVSTVTMERGVSPPVDGGVS